jgi:hypothetical protein
MGIEDIKNDPKIIKLCKSFSEKLPSDIEKVMYVGSVTGIAKELGDFILKNYSLNDLPREIQYLLAQIWNSYVIILCHDKVIDKISYDANMIEYFNNSHLDEKFAIIVKQLYNICKDNKLL